MTDIDFNEVFGIEEPEEKPEGAEEQEPAEPAADPEPAGENEQEAAEPAEDDDRQSPEENAAYAAARRKAEKERDAAIQQAREQMQEDTGKQLDAAIAALGLQNPYTGEAIKSKADMDAYQTARADEDRKRIADRAGLEEGEMDDFINNLPQVRAAKAAEEQAKQAAAKNEMQDQVRQIAEMDDSVKGIKDIVEHPRYGEILDKVRRGYSLADAYLVVNRAELSEKGLRAADQRQLNRSAKDHLGRTAERGEGDVEVPPEVREEYRDLMPGITDAEIRKHYSRYVRSKK